ncbi:hypothetical protein ES703_03025 [subsurface metagenome]
MKYLVHVSTTIEVDAENENEAIGIAADEIRGYKPKEFSYDVSTSDEETSSELS